MTKRIAVGTPVTVSASRGTYLNNYGMTHDDLVVLSHANGIGYGVGPSTNDPDKAHSRDGWIYFSAEEVTPKPAPAFKAGDKVEFIEEYMTYANKGTKATVTHDSIGEFTDVKVDATGKTLGPFTRRLKLIEEPALTLKGFTVGDKVRYKGGLWQNLEGVVSAINGYWIDVRVTKLPDNPSPWSSLTVGKTLTEVAGGKGIDPGSLEKIETPFTFKDIQVGDTIRRTATYKGATEVREGVVGTKGSYYFANEQGNYILAYDTDGTASITDVTLELLNRPEPEPVKEAWEDAKVLTRQYDDFPKDTFVREEDGSWTIHYGKGTATFKVTASENLADYLEDAKVTVLATA